MSTFFALFLWVGFIWIGGGAAWALPMERKPFFQQFESSFIEIIDELSPYYRQGTRPIPFYMRWMSWEGFKVHPQAKPIIFTEDCDPLDWAQKVSRAPGVVSEAWRHCEAQWESGDDNFLSNVVGSFRIQMDPLNHPMATQVLLNLPNGVKLKGFLALKGDLKKRPLVIFRTGLFSNMNEFFAERGFFIQAFDASPFNVLMIESLSGWDFIRNNKNFAMGGMDEGLQNIWIAKKIQSTAEPLSNIVHSVHLMATSMGGHGALFSAWINELNTLSHKQNRPIQSVFLYCPLVRFQETLEFHMAQGFSLAGINFWARKSMATLSLRYPEIRSEHFIADLLAKIEKNYSEPLLGKNIFDEIVIPKQIEEKFSKPPTDPPPLFWRLNNFWIHLENIKTPVLALSTVKDPVVPYEINANKLSDLATLGSNVEVVPLKSGYHCSLQVSHHWEPLSRLLTAYILKHAPDVPLQEQVLELEVTEPTSSWLAKNNLEYAYYFEVEQRTGEIYLVLVPQSKWFSFLGSWLSEKILIQGLKTEISWPYAFDETENAIRTRWLNLNVRPKFEGNRLVLRWPLWQ